MRATARPKNKMIMRQTKTLAAIAADIENGNNLHEYYNDNGATIKTGNFESFGDFLSYYRQHYRPLLEAIRNGDTLDEKQRHTLNFMADDLIKLFWEEDESEDTDEDAQPAHLLVMFNDKDQYTRARDFYCLKASEAPTAYFAEEYNDELRALYFQEDPDTMDALERDLDEDLTYYGFTGYHFEQE